MDCSIREEAEDKSIGQLSSHAFVFAYIFKIRFLHGGFSFSQHKNSQIAKQISNSLNDKKCHFYDMRVWMGGPGIH